LNSLKKKTKGAKIMDLYEFERIKNDFQNANVDKKIDIYCYTEDLSQEQYRQLLKLFPTSELSKLEAALR